MILSNTATPKYYAEFRQLVLNGQIPVCQEISLEMNRIDALIADPRFYYHESATEGYVKFCENELTLTDGSKMVLTPAFKLWAEQLYGWYYFVEKDIYVPYDKTEGKPGGRYVRKKIAKRLTKKQFLIVARGAAKSMYESTIQSKELVIEGDTSHQITTAPTMKQSEEVLSPIRTAILRRVGPLIRWMTRGSIHNTTGKKANRTLLASTKIGIQNFITGSWLEIRPMMIDKLQGLRCRVATIDEWLSGAVRQDPIGAIEQGASKNDDYIIIAASSEGTVRGGVGDNIKMELSSILRGEYFAPHISIWWYKLDDIKEVADPSKWVKAQPNLGITVGYDVYQLEVERMEKVPTSRNDILAKRFGIPMVGYTYFFSYEETIPFAAKEFAFWGMQASLGIDLSQGDDFCAFTFLFPLPNGKYGIKTRCYISERTLMKLPTATRDLYDQFIAEGSLFIMGKVTIDLKQVYDDLMNHINEREYKIRSVGYDNYGAKEFIEWYTMRKSSYGVERVIQGAITESVPLGELKDLSEERNLIFDQKLFSYCMGNSIVELDNNFNRKLSKLRYEYKIDAVSALMDAYVAYKRHIQKYIF